MSVVLLVIQGFLILVVYYLFVVPRWNPLRRLAGPPCKGIFQDHLYPILTPSISPRTHETYVHNHGRSIRIRGMGPWDERLLTLDPVSVAHVLKNCAIYEKPWQSRRLIESLIGCGLFAAEGQIHKLHRRVASPAFSTRNLRALVPLVFRKSIELKDCWTGLVAETPRGNRICKTRIDVYRWIQRATFDIIGLAGFDYDFNAIQDETNELFRAYKEMFEMAITQGSFSRTLTNIYLPWLGRIFPDKSTQTVIRCQQVIHHVAGQLIQEKKRKMAEDEASSTVCEGKDLLSFFLKANSTNKEDHISDEDTLNNINSFMFAGSDTSSLSLTWTLLLLAENPNVQFRLREELFSISLPFSERTAGLGEREDEVVSFYDDLSNLPYLHNVIRESLRLVPPVHSTIRVATEDDEIPIMYPIHMRDGTIDAEKRTFSICKGSLIHVPIEGFNLDKEIWGEDAWVFKWNNLPKAVNQLPGLFSNLLSFSAGPRSCIGMRFSLIELKTFLYVLLRNFVFETTGERVLKANIVLTRPYVSGRFKEGCQCPIMVSRYVPLS